MSECFKLEQLRPRNIQSKLGSRLVDQLEDLRSLTDTVESGFVNIYTEKPLSDRRVSYLSGLGIKANVGSSGEQVLPFYYTSVGGITRLARRPWVQEIEISKPLYPMKSRLP